MDFEVQQPPPPPPLLPTALLWARSKQAEEEEESWEARAFAQDTSSVDGGTWPPRFYGCTFCRRQFNSAQALGGHMNVHRRERARLRHSPSPSSSHQPALVAAAASTAIYPPAGLCLVYPVPASHSIIPTSSFISPFISQASSPLHSQCSLVAPALVSSDLCLSTPATSFHVPSWEESLETTKSTALDLQLDISNDRSRRRSNIDIFLSTSYSIKGSFNLDNNNNTTASLNPFQGQSLREEVLDLELRLGLSY